ncbi:MAG: patatin-like phospholipase family protein [Dehalococcoidales bacterium]|nr:MAG: patatin-like phospholipase family protein [Dehalococcoidales bacterium]
MGIENVDSNRKKVGLALGSGAARGLAHIGVLRVLERAGIPVDMIAGTSIGAFVGALCAHGKRADEILEIARDIGTHRLSYLVDMSLPRTGLIKGKKLENKLAQLYDGVEFNDLKLPFKCMATDIDTGKAVIMDKGLVWTAVRASISLPVILAVKKRENRYLVDGGLVDPVPVDVVRKMGADIVIAVNVMPETRSKSNAEPGIFDVIMQTIYIVSTYVAKDSLEGADIVIEPDVAGFKLSDFHKVDECVKLGEEAADNAVPRIKRLLA